MFVVSSHVCFSLNTIDQKVCCPQFHDSANSNMELTLSKIAKYYQGLLIIFFFFPLTLLFFFRLYSSCKELPCVAWVGLADPFSNFSTELLEEEEAMKELAWMSLNTRSAEDSKSLCFCVFEDESDVEVGRVVLLKSKFRKVYIAAGFIEEVK